MRLPTMASITAFFNSAGPETLVTTRQLIKFGPRSAIDTCIFKLVHTGIIVRVARGVFHLAGRQIPPSIEEVAKIKANSFGRKIMIDALKVAEDLELRQRQRNDIHQPCFQIDGRSSSFKCGDITVKFKGTSKKNFALGDSPQGKILRALQAVGKSFVTEDLCERALASLPSTHRNLVMESCSFVSAWLSDMLIRWFFTSAQQPNGPNIGSILLIEGSPTADTGKNVVSESSPKYLQFRPFKHVESRSSDTVAYYPRTKQIRKRE